MSDWYESHNIITNHNFRPGMLDLSDIINTKINNKDNEHIVAARKWCEENIYCWSVSQFENSDNHIVFRFPNKYDYYRFKLYWRKEMGWHFAARKITGDFGDTEYELVEVYPNLEDDSYGNPCHTEDGVQVFGTGSKTELAKWLRKAADDVEKYPAIEYNKKENDNGND